MSVELSGERGILPLLNVLDPVDGQGPEDGLPDLERPNVSGDLPTVLDAAPMFRRTVVGYDRYQVDTYVQWAEDELATAGREREHLEVRHLRTLTALEEAERLLAHSPAGAGFLRVSDRIGTLLAAAADEAEGLRADAHADRAAAAAEAERRLDRAELLLADARAAAAELVVRAAAEAQAQAAEARRVLERAEARLAAADVEAAARTEAGRHAELQAATRAERLLEDALAEASAARLGARSEIVAMLDAARGERRRADAAAAAERRRLDDEAAARRSTLRAEVRSLERRRSTLEAQVEAQVEALAQAAGRTRRSLDVRLRRFLEPLRRRSLRSP